MFARVRDPSQQVQQLALVARNLDLRQSREGAVGQRRLQRIVRFDESHRDKSVDGRPRSCGVIMR
jgi:hypothetical protein